MRNLFILSFLIFIACKEQNNALSVQQIIDKTIVYSGADKVSNSKINFNFRDRKYSATRQNGLFTLSRKTLNDSIITDEVLTNDGYKRIINNLSIKVSDSMISRYSNSINSVHYFSVLPYGLNDKAVHKKLLKPVKIKGKDYYKVEISFSEEGGGEDFEDVFIYWIGKEDFLVDYLAYSYHTNGGGKRFRVLKEQCVKAGIRFVDYHNYKPLQKEITLNNIDVAFEKNQLKKVSEIVLKDIEVKVFN